MSNLMSRNDLSQISLREVFATVAIIAGSTGYAFFSSGADVAQKADKAGTTLSDQDKSDLSARAYAGAFLFNVAGLAGVAALAAGKKKGNSPIF